MKEIELAYIIYLYISFPICIILDFAFFFFFFCLFVSSPKKKIAVLHAGVWKFICWVDSPLDVFNDTI